VLEGELVVSLLVQLLVVRVHRAMDLGFQLAALRLLGLPLFQLPEGFLCLTSHRCEGFCEVCQSIELWLHRCASPLFEVLDSALICLDLRFSGGALLHLLLPVLGHDFPDTFEGGLVALFKRTKVIIISTDVLLLNNELKR